jgi:SRSO17 transposase
VVRRPPSDATCLADGVRVAGPRWQMAGGVAAANSAWGLAAYEVRQWHAWHRHGMLARLAHAFLVGRRKAGKKSDRARGAAAPDGT